MSAVPGEPLSEDEAKRGPPDTTDWGRRAAILALVLVLLLVIANSMIANRRYGAGRR